jgi:hypothetical protein
MAQGKGFGALTRRVKLSKRGWRILGIAGGIVALAIVVLVTSAVLTDPKPSYSPEASAIAKQTESETLTDRGLVALSANDTATAETLLQRAVALNPQNQRATIALAQLRQPTSTASSGGSGGGSSAGGSGGSGSSTGGSGSNPSAGTPSPFDKKVDIAKLLPVTAAGYTMYPPQVSDTEAQVSGDPATKGVRVIWAVHDRGTSAAAAKFVTKVSKSAYAKNGQTASIDGASAYLGTDGSRYATAVYVRGRYVFEVLVSLATPSAEVVQALPIAKAAASAFPDTP